MPTRFRIVVSRGGALGVGSGVAVLLASGLLATLVRLEPATPPPSEPGSTFVADARPIPHDATAPRRATREPNEPMPVAASRPGPTTPRAATRGAADAPVTGRVADERSDRSAPATRQPSAPAARRENAAALPGPADRREAPAPAALPSVPAGQPAPPAAPTEPVARLPASGDTPHPDPASAGVLERARRMDELAKQGDLDRARAEAEVLLAEHPSSSGLIDTLGRGGAGEVEARLAALRALQLGGQVATSQDLARELKRGYAGTREVVETIERWGVLTPRIVSVESSIEDGEYVVVTGTVENPDIGEVRQVEVVVEALDAAGSRIATTETRVRPKVLAPGGRGDFVVRFKRIDPASVLRTRSSVVAWRAEVASAG